MRALYPAAVAVGLLTAGLFAAAAMCDPPRPADAAPAAGTPPVPQPRLTVRLFRLERAAPDDVLTALNNLLEEATTYLPDPPAGRPPAATPPAGLGITGCGLGGGFIGGMPQGTPVVHWRAATDDRVRVVAVRGSERHHRVAADVVAVLDRPPAGPLPKVAELLAFPLTHATADGVREFFDALEMREVRTHSAGERLLLVSAPESDRKTVAEVVAALDVPDKPARDAAR